MSDMYCSLNDVKRLLRSLANRESKIRFSSAYRDLKEDSNNTGTIYLSGVDFSTSFADHDTYTFEFIDSTSFSVTSDILGTLGSGDRFSTFSSTGKFSVPSSNWTGYALAGDKVYITAASDISDEDGEKFIEDSTKKIKGKLLEKFGSVDDFPFEISSVPDQINYACIRYTAYDIFNSMFAGMSTENGESPVEFWKNDADEALFSYLSSHGKGPVWKSRPVQVDTIGIEGIGDGEIDLRNLTDPKNKEYKR